MPAWGRRSGVPAAGDGTVCVTAFVHERESGQSGIDRPRRGAGRLGRGDGAGAGGRAGFVLVGGEAGSASRGCCGNCPRGRRPRGSGCSPGSAWSWAPRACRSPRWWTCCARWPARCPPTSSAEVLGPAAPALPGCCPSCAGAAARRRRGSETCRASCSSSCSACSTGSARVGRCCSYRGPALGRPVHPGPDRVPGPVAAGRAACCW